MIIENLNRKDFNYLKDEPNTKGNLGITYNRIVEIPNFISDDTAASMVKYFNFCEEQWGPIAFYGSKGMGLPAEDENFAKFGLQERFFEILRNKFKEAVEIVFEEEVRPNTSHAQKWDVGGFANPHSDNSDKDGVPSAFAINKYVGILYLNDNYEGGNLYFPEHDISFKPNKNSYYVFCGGVENIHGVTEILSGTRYTMVSFWDYKDAEYDQDTLDAWEKELLQTRKDQEEQFANWEKGVI
jgi:hypothetical protein